MSYPDGAKYAYGLTANSSKCVFDGSHFLYQYDASNLLSDSTFKSEILSINNISVYDKSSEVECIKVVKLDLDNNKLWVYFDGPMVSGNDNNFEIIAGKGLNSSNSYNSFTNNNYRGYWGFNEFSDGPTTYDEIELYNGTVTSPGHIGNAAKFGNGFYDGASISTIYDLNFGDVDYINGGEVQKKRTFEFVVEVNSSWGVSKYIMRKHIDSVNNLYISCCYDTLRFKNSYCYDVLSNGYHHYFIMFNGYGLTNDDRLVVIIDGTQRSLTHVASVPTQIPNTVGVDWKCNYYRMLCELGIMDELFGGYFAASRYDMIINPSDFWSIGSKRINIGKCKDLFPIF